MAVRDIIMAAGGSAATGAAVYVEEVFQTYLYTGNGLYPSGGGQSINNGVDLAGKGGMVWIKCRSGGNNHAVFDTSRTSSKLLGTSSTAEEYDAPNTLTSFNNNGFSLGSEADGWDRTNTNAKTYVSWTFRKAAKFFDVVTWTGTGVARTISHDLGCVPGMIIVKCTSQATNWPVYHKSLAETNRVFINLTNASGASSTMWNNTAPTSSVFSVGTDAGVNDSGHTYVAYLFADSNSGGFGAAGTDSVVACGSFTENGTEQLINLGWEPQFVIIKRIDSTGNWLTLDNMRGFHVGSLSPMLNPNLANAETANAIALYPSSNGFIYPGGTTKQYIYLAIRRGPMKTPTDATKVFAPVTYSGNASARTLTTGFPVDAEIVDNRGGSAGWEAFVFDKLRGGAIGLTTSSTSAEVDNSTYLTNEFQSNTGVNRSGTGVNYSGLNAVTWTFRRAPGFFDVVCYTGDGVDGRTITHNLGVAPEWVIIKRRNSTGNWVMSDNSTVLYLNKNTYDTGVYDAGLPYYPTNTWFGVSSGGSATQNDVNASGSTYVAYLFATCAGVSKVGSYTGNGSSQTINCGFASGARFVLIKRTDSTGSWWVFDSARGIVSAADPALQLNSTAAETTSADAIDPDSTGFIVNQETTCNLNVSSATYIYLAIA